MHALKPNALLLLATLLATLLGVISCKERPATATRTAATTKKPAVVATTGMIGDVAKNIAGDRANVTWLMGEGVDPHLYKASPGDVRTLSDADLILYNGLHLEGRMADVITKMAAKHTVVQVTETIDESTLRQPPEFAGHFDPHVWFDVTLWSKAAERIRDALIEKDPQNKDAYTANAAAYLTSLASLHDYAKATIATIPADKRIMVTAHDAFGYLGRAYGLQVLAIQGISTDSEASLQDINHLVDTLVKDKIPAVFIESSVSRKTIDALVEGCKSKGHNVLIGGELFSDAMGQTGTPEGTYLGMVVHNVDTITKALGGSVPDTKPLPPAPAEKH